MALLLFLIIVFQVSMYYNCNSIETPQYTVIRSDLNLEVRLYKESQWMSAAVQGTTSSFKKSTHEGFHRLYQYIHGANRESSRLMMTAPVLTSISPPTHSSEYVVRYLMSSTLNRVVPEPDPELNLKIQRCKAHCIAVRKFSGFANDGAIDKEYQALLNSMESILTGKAGIVADKTSFAIAQYNASFHLTGRLNEVWINVAGFRPADGC